MLCYSAPPTHDFDFTSDSKSLASRASYSAGTTARHSHVLITQPDGRALHKHTPDKHQNNLGLAIVVMLCFNPPFGIGAVILAMKSNNDMIAGEYNSARTKGKCSMFFSVVGILVTAVGILLAIFWPLIRKSP